MSALDTTTTALVRVAAAIPNASEAELEELMETAVEAGTQHLWLQELVLSSVLYVGFPRALVAAGALRRVDPQSRPEGEGLEGGGYENWQQWARRGEETCRIVYGRKYELLRRNVRLLHPALDLWMVVDGYGKTLSRPGLDLVRRELCSIAMLVPQDAPRQLLSHFKGALNAGATAVQIDSVLDVARFAAPLPRFGAAMEIWLRLRESLEPL